MADAVEKILGPFGKWQLRSTLLIFLVKIPSSWFMACLIFTAKSPIPGEIFCSPPAEVLINNTDLWIKSAHREKFNRIENEQSYDFCSQFQHAAEKYQNITNVDENLDNIEKDVEECLSFEHRPVYFSIIHQYELFCSKEALVALTQSFHLLGVLLGGIIANYMLKSISPKRTMLAGMISQIFLGLATGYSPTYELHIIFRCSVAATCSMMCIGIMTVSDITSGKYRITAVCLFEQFWSIGVILLPGVGSWWNSWSIVYVAITLPTFILIFLYPWIPDSPRWLLKHGKIDEAKAVLTEAANVNGHYFSEDDLDKMLLELADKMKSDPPEPGLLGLWKDTSDVKRKLFVMHVVWSIYLMLYFGLLLHVRAMGRQYLEVNTAIAGVSELIGTFIGLALILKTTKKWLWMSLLNILTSCISFSAIFVPDTVSPFQRMVIYMATSMLEKMTVSTSLSIFITSNTEVVSKDKKKICNYSGVTCSRTLVMIAPFIGYCAVFGQLVPQVIMVFMNIGAAVLVASIITTPRTIPKNVANNLPTQLQLHELSESKKCTWTQPQNELTKPQ